MSRYSSEHVWTDDGYLGGGNGQEGDLAFQHVDGASVFSCTKRETRDLWKVERFLQDLEQGTFATGAGRTSALMTVSGAIQSLPPVCSMSLKSWK